MIRVFIVHLARDPGSHNRGRTPRFPEGQPGPVALAEVELPGVLFVHQLCGVVHVVQSQDVSQFMHDDGTDQRGTVGPGECFGEAWRVKRHLAGDGNVGFARNLD